MLNKYSLNVPLLDKVKRIPSKHHKVQSRHNAASLIEQANTISITIAPKLSLVALVSTASGRQKLDGSSHTRGNVVSEEEGATGKLGCSGNADKSSVIKRTARYSPERGLVEHARGYAG